MRVFAAVDLRGGDAVQLVGGEPGSERVRERDPAAVARRWVEAGFRHLHVVDLDAALGTGKNRGAIMSIARSAAASRAGGAAPVMLQAGGGVRSRTAVDALLDLGADRVIVGTRAVEDRAWLEAVATARPGRLVVAADVRDGRVVTHGWRRTTELDAAGLLAALAPLPLAAALITDVGREGREGGADAPLFRTLVAASPHPVLAAGGVAGPDDLDALARAGVAGVVVGMALYTGRLRPADALRYEEDG